MIAITSNISSGNVSGYFLEIMLYWVYLYEEKGDDDIRYDYYFLVLESAICKVLLFVV